jgi:hypothetical protein
MGKISSTFRLDEDLMERVRNAIWHIGQGLTITDLMEQGLEEVVKQLEKKHNKGKQFPARAGEVPKSPKGK